MDKISDKISDIEHELLAIKSHSKKMTSGNISHNNAYIKGAADLCLDYLNELKLIITLCQK